MTPEELRALQESIEQLRTQFTAAVDVGARLDTLETSLRAEGATEISIRTELDAITQAATERQEQLDSLVQRNRVAGMGREGIHERREGLAVLGMIARQQIAGMLRMDLGTRFADETTRIADYQARATLSADASPGSLTLPTILETEILDSLEEVSPVLSRVDFQTGLPGNVDIPVLTSRPSFMHKRASVDTDMTASSLGLSIMQVRPDEGYVFFPVDNRLLEMTAFNLGSMILRLMRESVIEGLVNDLFNGDGTSAFNGITGILNEASADYIYTMPAGVNVLADVTKTHLRGAMATALRRARGNGVFMGSLDFLDHIEDLDRTGKTSVIKERDNGDISMLSRMFLDDQDLPVAGDIVADTPAFAFGDLSTYLVALTGGIGIEASTEFLFGKNQTCFRSVINYDIQRKPVKTFVLAKTNAA